MTDNNNLKLKCSKVGRILLIYESLSQSKDGIFFLIFLRKFGFIFYILHSEVLAKKIYPYEKASAQKLISKY